VVEARVLEMKDIEADVVHDENPPVVELSSPHVVNGTSSPEPVLVDIKVKETNRIGPGPIIDSVPIPVTEEAKLVESLLVMPLPSGKSAPTSQESVPEPAVEPTPVVTEGNDAPVVDDIKEAPASEFTSEVAMPSISEVKADEVVGPTPAAGLSALPATNEPLAAKPFPVLEEALSTKENGEPNDTTTEPGAGDQMFPNERGTPPATVTPTEKAPTGKFPSASTPQSMSASAGSSPSSSKFNSRRKKTTSFLGKLKNIFDHDKAKEKK